MIGDPQRLQYLEAMGITAWVSRYRFANARPTGQSEWQTPAVPEKPAPGQRLQALLETPARPAEQRRPELTSASGDESGFSTAPSNGDESSPVSSRARALLDGSASGGRDAPRAAPQSETAPPAESTEAVEPSAEPVADPLRFTLSLAVIGERWWLMLPGERPLSPAGQALLEQMLKSVALPSSWSPVSPLTWPLMDLPAVDPAGEARDGIQVFCAGQARRRELDIQGAIVIGDEVWSPLLSEPADGDAWSYHALPHPDDLLSSAKAKRDCWPHLQAIADAWKEHPDRTP